MGNRDRLLWSMMLAVAHENDIRIEAQTIWNRRFALPWMLRVRAVGVPIPWEWVLAAYLLTAFLIVWIWARPLMTLRRQSD